MSKEKPTVPDPASCAPQHFLLKDWRPCIIRSLIESDAEEVRRLFPLSHTESDFLMYMPGEFDLTLEQEREFIRERTGKPGAMLIAAELDGRLVALGGAESLKFKRMRHHAELGVTVLKEFWGMGLGRKMTELIMEWGRRQGLRKLYLRVFDDNRRGIALYDSLGFIEEGRLKGDVLRCDGTYTDTIVMAKFYP